MGWDATRDSYNQKPGVGRKPHIKADDEDAESQILMFDVEFPLSAHFIFFLWFIWAIFKVVKVAHCQISCWKKAQFGRWSGGTGSLEYNKIIYISLIPHQHHSLLLDLPSIHLTLINCGIVSTYLRVLHLHCWHGTAAAVMGRVSCASRWLCLTNTSNRRRPLGISVASTEWDTRMGGGVGRLEFAGKYLNCMES